ncbi:MAG TPA: hypothetical protein VFZ66_02600 [Herpetosiphonaceae bacterium]
MVTLTLTPEEAAQLRLVLTTYLTDLRSEIRATDTRSFRAQLQEREVLIGKLLHELSATAEEATA